MGDEVWAADPETGEAGARPVTALIEGTGEKDLVTVTTESGSVVATAGHPFWSASEASWVDAGDLRIGDAVLELDGSESVVTATSEATVQATVHNLTVAQIHTYFVFVGDAPTLVHNCGGGVIGNADELLPTPQVGSTRLQNIVSNLYGGTRNPARHGNGTTMDAVRFEASTGLPVHGRTHTIKAQESLSGLENWLVRNPQAPFQDRLVARSLADELSEVLSR